MDLFSLMNMNSINQTNYWFEFLKLILTSWPLFFMIIVLMFRQYLEELLAEIINKIKLITKFRYKDWEATIDKTIDENKVSENKLNIEDEYAELPAYIQFIMVWIKFEANIRSKIHINSKSNGSIIQIMRPLVREIISPDEYNILKEINHYRNLLIHENYTNIPEEQNYKFIEFLEALTEKINNAFDNIKESKN